MKKTLRDLQDMLQESALLMRFYYTLLLTSIFRLGCLIPLPGLPAAFIKGEYVGADDGSMIQFLDGMLGGSLGRYAILSLGIYPYVSASILVQVLSLNSPYFRRLKTQEGAAGRAKLTLHTRQIALLIAPFKGFALLRSALKNKAFEANIQSYGVVSFYVLGILLLVSGTLAAIWISDQITEKGIGNGSSVLIASGILSQFHIGLAAEYQENMIRRGPLLFAILLFLSLGFLTYLVINFTQGVRRIPLQYARAFHSASRMGLRSRRQYLPLKLNGAGVMPIIMASMISTVPRLISEWMCSDWMIKHASSWVPISFFYNVSQVLKNRFGWRYNLFFFTLIFLSTYLWTAFFINPTEMSTDLKKRNAFIPGIKPGKETANYVDNLLTYITLPSSFFLAVIAILPAVAYYLGVSERFANYCGGTSVIIIVGTIIEMIQQIKTYLFNKQYQRLIQNHQLASLHTTTT